MVQDSRGRTAGTGQPGQDSLGWIAREDSRDNTARTGKRGREGQNKAARTGRLGQDY